MSDSTTTVPHPESVQHPLGEFSRIVVGVDGSASSIDALREAERLAEAFGSRLDVVCAWSYPISNYGMVPPDWYPDRDAARTVHDVADTVFGETRPEWVHTSIREGAPARVLITESDTADLVVTGSRGHGGFSGLLLGSVSSEIAAHAHSPVLIVHPRPETKTGSRALHEEQGGGAAR